MAAITLKGSVIHTVGELPAVGSRAPDFKLTRGDLSDASLADYRDRVRILNIVPEPRHGDLRPLGQEIQRGDQEAARGGRAQCQPGPALRPIALLQGRGGRRRRPPLRAPGPGLRDCLRRGPSQDGPMAGLLSRAVVVVDALGKVVYAQQVSEIGSEPDYAAALAAARKAADRERLGSAPVQGRGRGGAGKPARAAAAAR